MSPMTFNCWMITMRCQLMSVISDKWHFFLFSLSFLLFHSLSPPFSSFSKKERREEGEKECRQQQKSEWNMSEWFEISQDKSNWNHFTWLPKVHSLANQGFLFLSLSLSWFFCFFHTWKGREKESARQEEGREEEKRKTFVRKEGREKFIMIFKKEEI